MLPGQNGPRYGSRIISSRVLAGCPIHDDGRNVGMDGNEGVR
jgi:hypothetical protein